MKTKEKIKKSELFWTGLLLVVLIIIGIIKLEFLYVILGMGSLIAIGAMFDRGLDDDDVSLWLFLMPITWVLIIFARLGLGLAWLYDRTIQKFNSWLNKEK